MSDLFWGIPDEETTFGSGGDDEFLAWGDGDLGDGSRMSNTLVVADSLIVVPELDDLVFSSGDKVLAFGIDGESVDFSRGGGIEHADGLAIEAVPVGDLAVRSGGQELRLIWVEDDLLELGRFKEALQSDVLEEVPDDAGSVVRGRHSLGVVSGHLNVGDSSSVLLKRALHDLGLSADSPEADLTFHASRNDSGAVVGWLESGYAVVVGVVDGVVQLSRLWKEGSDLAIVPTRDDALTIWVELDRVALEAWNLNSEELLSSLGVPDTDVVG